MRKYAIRSILCLAISLLPGLDLMAYTFEAHPGLYTSYEYSDNYQGVSEDKLSESTYYVGPSLNLRCFSPSATFDLSGRYARSFHQRSPEDDSHEVLLTSQSSFTFPLQTLQLAYGYVQTWSRASLNEPFGEVRRNTGNVGYTGVLTHSTRMNAGINYQTEDRNIPQGIVTTELDEGVTTLGGNIGISHQINPQDVILLSAGRSLSNYQTIQDVTDTNFAINLNHAISPITSLGIATAYNHSDRGRDPYEDRYDASLTGQYSIDPSTNMNISGGYSWLIMEKLDRQESYIARLSLDKSLGEDRFNLSIAKEYTAEYSTNRYGTYDTKTASLSWVKQWVQTWSSSTGLSISKRISSTGISGEDVTDSNANVTLTWRPIEYFTGNIIYEHLQTKYSTSGTVRENRYTMTVEVRY